MPFLQNYGIAVEFFSKERKKCLKDNRFFRQVEWMGTKEEK